MLNFNKFNPDNFKTDMDGYLVETEVLFIRDSLVMLGTLRENSMCPSSYYIVADYETFNITNATLVCEVNVEV